jgi:hypothetical protein
LLSFFFIDNSFNPNRSNQASPGQGFNLGGQINLSEVYNYYYLTASEYSQTGIGANVNGAPVPVGFNPHDRIYSLPVSFGQTDSSASGYEIDLTSTIGIYYLVSRTRHNSVDGWGQLIMPSGTYDVLRVHTTMTEQDSVYVDSLGFGIMTPLIVTHEYKWLRAGGGIPVLQINTSDNGTVTEIKYRDTSNTSFVPQQKILTDNVTVFPNPANHFLTVRLSSAKGGYARVELLAGNGGRLVAFEELNLNQGLTECMFDLRKQKLASGTYFIRVKTESGVELKQFLVGK